MKPLLRWAGSKRLLLPRLRQYASNIKGRYVEPFCGSACLFFDLEPQRAILGDVNTDLVQTYKAISLDAALVCECLKRLRTGRRNYYKVRAVDPDDLSNAERAARFLYLNHYCFNGIYRTNLAGHFNVPYGPPKSGRNRDLAEILDAELLLRKAILINGDFEKTLEQVEKEDFVYLDPPYAVSSRRIFAEYHPNTFALHDLERLGKCLDHLNQMGAKFVISYAASAEARNLLS